MSKKIYSIREFTKYLNIGHLKSEDLQIVNFEERKMSDKPSFY
jgi:hypothetical protein